MNATQLSLFDLPDEPPRANGGERFYREVAALGVSPASPAANAPAPAEAKQWARAARRLALARWAAGLPPSCPAVVDARRRALAALGGKVSI